MRNAVFVQSAVYNNQYVSKNVHCVMLLLWSVKSKSTAYNTRVTKWLLPWGILFLSNQLFVIIKTWPKQWTASSEFGTYRLCEQRRFRRACASAQSRQNLRCSLILAVNQEKPSDRKPDPWPLWMAGHAQLKFVMTECSKTQIRLTGLTV